MTIDAKKIIPKLSVSLEDEEWEKLKEIRNWGVLIRETYGNFIYAVGCFKESATYILKTTEDMWKGWKIKEAYRIIITSVTRRSSNRFYYLELEHTSENMTP